MLQQDEELLSAYLDNEVGEEELNRVNERLTVSPEWRDGLAKFRETKNLIAGVPSMPLPDDLLQTLLRQADLPVKAPPVSRWEWSRLWVVGGSFATAAVVTLLWMGTRHIAGAVEELPLEPLLAAHVRYQPASLHEAILAASDYSAEMKRSHADEK